MSPISQKDYNFINLALRISKKNIGITGENPAVGCVIVNDTTILATGVTGKNGVPHAESVALEQAGINANGATLYVTLEPCSHFGKTPPCVDSIIKSKIARVVIATVDPNPRVNGMGIEKLKAAGIEVVVGVMSKEARELNRGFFSVKTLHRPHVTLKLATSLDGKIATKNYHSKWITNQKSRDYAHYLRAKNDAILIGANTLKHDNPMLDCRLLGLENHSPKRIIVSTKLDIDLKSQIIQSAHKIPTYIATNNIDNKRFLELGVKIITCSNLENTDQINLGDLLKKLVSLGVNNLLIEGGSQIATGFLKAELIDKLIWAKSNKIIGNDGIPAVGDLGLDLASSAESFTRVDLKEFDDEVILVYKKN